MLVIELITAALIKAQVRKRKIIIVLIVIYIFFLFGFIHMFYKHHRDWRTALLHFMVIGGMMYIEMKDEVKFINSEQERMQSK